MQDQSSLHQHSPIPPLLPPMSIYSLHPTHSSRPPLCRMELTGSKLSSQDQQPKGPNPIPRVSHWYPKFVSSQLVWLWGCARGGQSSW